jgi:O-methyltransferase
LALPPDKKPLPLPALNEISLERGTNFDSHTYWGVQEANRPRFAALMDEAKTLVERSYFLGDNLFTWTRNNSALEDRPFRKAWEDNLMNPADEAIVWRRYILACAAYHCLHVPGDFVECGVYVGTGIKTVMDYLGGTEFPKTFWGYDTYDYNPVEGHAFAGQEAGFYDKVCARFEGYPQVRLIRGLLPDSFAGNEPAGVAFLHIDLNNVQGEIAVLEHLFDRVNPGGIIVLDDYEWSGIYRAQKMAEDQWFDRRKYRIFPLPTGQGLVLKR